MDKIMNLIIKKGQINKNIEISAPPSKSFSHRMIISAALASGKSTLTNFSLSQDMEATLDCIKCLGCDYNIQSDFINGKKSQSLSIRGNINYKASSSPENIGKNEPLPIFNCRESGSTLRFFIPIALAIKGNCRFTGSERLLERGIGVYQQLLSKKGIIIKEKKDCFELFGKLTGGQYSLQGNVSSQFITGLMFALPLLDQDSSINIIPPLESASYLQMTIEVLKEFGIEIQKKSDFEYYIRGNQKYISQNKEIEGDWSNAAALLAFGGKVTGLNENSSQGDKICKEIFKSLSTKSEKELTQKENYIDISDCPDLGPMLFAFAAAHQGGHFTGCARLKIKESDRANAMKVELSKFSISIEVLENEVIIKKESLKIPEKNLDSHNDHRIVMALTYLASLTGGKITNAQAINKSFPDYFEKLKEMGLSIEVK